MSAARIALPAHWAARGSALQQRWRALPQRERRLVILMLAAISALLLWLAAIQPAWRTLREAPARLASLESQLQQMRILAAEAAELRAAPRLGAEQSVQALKAATARLGDKARLQLQGERAVVTLNGVASAPLREWLAESRSGARARPVEARLSRSGEAYAGTVVFTLGGTP